MKKILSLLLCAALAAALCACGSSGASGGSSGGQVPAGDSGGTADNPAVYAKFEGELERGIVIRVLENDTAIEQGYFEELLDAFNEAYAEYGIVAEDANMDQYLDLANDGPYGYGPDVLYQANDVLMKNVDGKHITPLPVEKLECYSQIPQAAWDAYTAVIDGQTYVCAAPVNFQAPLLYYRKDNLPQNWETEWDDDANGTPDMLENWNAMYRYSLQRQTEGHFGYMKSLYDVYFSAGYLFSYGGYVFGAGNKDPADIGFAAGNAALGAQVVRQLAGAMSEDCIDNTVTLNSYSRLAQGDYFATMTTPDVRTLFVKELALVYAGEGLSEAEALKKADENIATTRVPMLPASGDLSEENPELIPFKAMGGINGYAISSYTKYPKACLAFIDFATSYQMVTLRNQKLGIYPVRNDAADDLGGLSQELFADLHAGNIVVMPSISAVAQIWTPGETLFSDIAKDPFRPLAEQKYTNLDAFQAGLDEMAQQIYDAVFTLK